MSQVGKTFFTKRLLENAEKMFTIPPDKIVYAYSHYQELFDEMLKTIPNICFHLGLPSTEDIESYSAGAKHTILILDDLMLKIVNSVDLVTLFTITAHHSKISVIFITQNLYPPGKYSKCISLNCHVVVVFKNARDERQITTLGSQMFPGKAKFFKISYDKSTSKQYGYLVIDGSPHQDPLYQLRTNIFPGEECIVYRPIN